jgi:hypothetical protein
MCARLAIRIACNYIPGGIVERILSIGQVPCVVLTGDSQPRGQVKPPSCTELAEVLPAYLIGNSVPVMMR